MLYDEPMINAEGVTHKKGAELVTVAFLVTLPVDKISDGQ